MSTLLRGTKKKGMPDWYRWDGGWYQVDGEHTKYFEWPIEKTDCILEIGAYEGRWVIEMVRRYECQGFAFEPSSRALRVARERAAEAGVGIVFQPYAVGNGKREAVLYDCNRDGATLFPGKDWEKPGDDKGYSEEPVTVLDISDTLELWGIKPWALVAINIEGGEFEVLSRLIETDHISWLERIMIQWHQPTKEDHDRMVEIQTNLALTHEMLWNHGAWEAWQKKE